MFPVLLLIFFGAALGYAGAKARSKQLPRYREKVSGGAAPAGAGRGAMNHAKLSLSPSIIDAAVRWARGSTSDLLVSPFPFCDNEKWTKFVRKLTAGASDMKGAIGAFAMSPRRLADLGIVEVDSSGQIVRWNDESEARFSSNPDVQYRAFASSMGKYAKEIIDNHDASFGANDFIFFGQPATLSGLLAAVHRAGSYDNLASWLTDEKDRSKFKATSAAYQACNGIF